MGNASDSESKNGRLEKGVFSDIEDSQLQKRVASVLKDNLQYRQLSAETNAAWQIMHGALPYGSDLPLLVGDEQFSAIEFLLSGQVSESQTKVDGWRLLPGVNLPGQNRTGMTAELNPGGFIGQGHSDQWLAILSQADLELTQPIVVGDEVFTLEDWGRQAQFDIARNLTREYSWTLIALMNLFPNDTRWRGSDGNDWEFESIVRFEAEQDLINAACGGTHRLMALAHTVKFREQNKIANEGGWRLAEERLQSVLLQARKWQNSDGSFSSNYTERPGRTVEISNAISTTGHMFEVAAFALTDEQIAESWMEAACSRLCELLEATISIDLDCGGLYHALNGLKIYQQRRWPSESAS